MMSLEAPKKIWISISDRRTYNKRQCWEMPIASRCQFLGPVQFTSVDLHYPVLFPHGSHSRLGGAWSRADLSL